MGKTKWSYEVEARAVVRALRKLGYDLDRVDYDNGWGEVEGSEKITLKASQVEKAVKAIIAVDASHLYVKTPKGQSLFFYLVLGNGPGELVADWLIPRSLAERVDLDFELGALYEKFDGKAR
tara:strand:+ start:162 stop:527 length:366 start_codon:yes stop_codon:yes gene_type:complete